jgi:hypothetical protein
MERNIEHEVIKALAEKNIELTIRTNLNGYRIDCIVEPRSYDKMELHEFSGETLKAALANMLNDPAFMGKIDSDLLMVLCAEDEEKAEKEIIDTFSINNPYLAELRTAMDKALQSAAQNIEDCDTATVTAKVVLNMDDFAPDFANDAKLFSPAKFAVNVGIKRDVTKITGQTKYFVTRVVDGRMLLVDPDRQITLDEALKKADEQTADVPIDADDDDESENDDADFADDDEDFDDLLA